MTDDQSEHSASRIEAEVARARALLEQRRFAEALAAAEGLRAQVPENRDVLYLIAVNLRYLGRAKDALAGLQEFERLHPGYGRLYQERGHCHRTFGDTEAAIEAYRRAVTLNPALPASWKALSGLYQKTGRRSESQEAANVAATLEGLPPVVVAANSLFAEGETGLAETKIRNFLLQNPQHVEAMRLLARIGLKLEVLDDAEFLLQSIVELEPDYHAARLDYAEVLIRRHKHAEARDQIRRLLAIEPDNPVFRTLEGNALVGLGEHEAAIKVFNDLRKDTPQNPTLHLAIAHAQKTIGRQQAAIESYRRATEIQPSFGDAYWSLANLKTYRFTNAEIAQMREQEAAPTTNVVDRYHLCFALGKALEDRGEFAESFHFYERGNAFKKDETRFDPETLERNMRRQMEVCTQDFFAARQGWGYHSPDPIFIVGLPRAGSTLIEQILASHSEVDGTKELAEIPRLVQLLNGRESNDSTPRYPSALTEVTAEQFTRFGEKFIAETRVYRKGKPFFIDKMPNNFRHIGLIHLILPQAKIIDARREPMACCFSNYKQLFANGQEFTYDLGDIARYYRNYVELMDHWNEILPGKVLRVQHEDLVADLEGNVRGILDYCGLAFEAGCLEFHKTERSVRTASSEQVRRPIYREGLDQWRNFEPWLASLYDALKIPA